MLFLIRFPKFPSNEQMALILVDVHPMPGPETALPDGIVHILHAVLLEYRPLFRGFDRPLPAVLITLDALRLSLARAVLRFELGSPQIFTA